MFVDLPVLYGATAHGQTEPWPDSLIQSLDPKQLMEG
jgi:hypothetical protein